MSLALEPPHPSLGPVKMLYILTTSTTATYRLASGSVETPCFLGKGSRGAHSPPAHFQSPLMLGVVLNLVLANAQQAERCLSHTSHGSLPVAGPGASDKGAHVFQVEQTRGWHLDPWEVVGAEPCRSWHMFVLRGGGCLFPRQTQAPQLGQAGGGADLFPRAPQPSPASAPGALPLLSLNRHSVLLTGASQGCCSGQRRFQQP